MGKALYHLECSDGRHVIRSARLDLIPLAAEHRAACLAVTEHTGFAASWPLTPGQWFEHQVGVNETVRSVRSERRSAAGERRRWAPLRGMVRRDHCGGLGRRSECFATLDRSTGTFVGFMGLQGRSAQVASIWGVMTATAGTVDLLAERARAVTRYAHDHLGYADVLAFFARDDHETLDAYWKIGYLPVSLPPATHEALATRVEGFDRALGHRSRWPLLD